MSTHSLPQEINDKNSVQRLLKENKMKELALKKAKNLIELLNIELQVERNASHENSRALQFELKNKHQYQMSEMHGKIRLMQLQLKRRSQTSIECERTIRKAPLSRESSSKSAEIMRRRAVTRKLTETINFEQVQSEPNIQMQVSLELYKQQISQFETWKRGIMIQMDQLIKKQYEDLESLINRIDESSEEYRELGSPKQRHKDNTNEIYQIIRKQNTLINGLFSYSQQLQNLCKSTNSQLSSIVLNENYAFEQHRPLQFAQITKNIKDLLYFNKQKTIQQREELEAENKQLKNIIENLISIVKKNELYRF